MIEVKCLEVDIDDTKLNIDIHAKCRYCDKKIGFCNNIFEIYYCSQHGFLLNQAYIMYFAKKRNNHDSNDIVIKNPNITNKGECPYKKKYGTCLMLIVHVLIVHWKKIYGSILKTMK